jgi:hypothetical protein
MGEKILVPLLDGVVYRIAEMRTRELRLLWELPKRFEDGAELPPTEIEQRKAAFQQEYEEQSAEIEKETAFYAEVQNVCHRGVFLYEQKWPINVKPLRPFPDFIERENVAIGKAIDFIEKSLAKYRERLFSSIREDPTYAEMKDEELFAVMQFDEVMQVESLEKSVRRTERELSFSRRNLLMVAVRRMDINNARMLIKQLRVGHERDIAGFAEKRQNSRRELDVESVRSIDEKIAGNHFSESRILIPCFDDAIRDIVEGTIWNYRQNIAEIEQNFTKEKEILDKNNSERKKKLMEQGKQNRQAIEKKKTETTASLDHRMDAIFRDIQDRIRVLLDEKNYREAAAEKRRLDLLLEEVRDRTQFQSCRMEKVQQKITGEKAERDQAVVTQVYNKKLLKLTQERDRLMMEQRSFFPSQIAIQIRKFVGWIIKLYPQGVTKREYLMKYERMAKGIVAENHLEDLMQ